MTGKRLSEQLVRRLPSYRLQVVNDGPDHIDDAIPAVSTFGTGLTNVDTSFTVLSDSVYNRILTAGLVLFSQKHNIWN